MGYMDSSEEREIGGLIADIRNIKEMITRMQEKDDADHKRLSTAMEDLQKKVDSLTKDVTWGKAFIAIMAFLGGIAYFIVGEIRHFFSS